MSISAVDGYNSLGLTNNNVNFRSEKVTIPEQKPDTVEISSKQKKKEGMSTGMKLLLGIGGTGVAIYGALVTHRAVTRPSLEKLQKEFKEIFRRDVSLEEIPDMLKKYQDILKIKDEKEFCQKAFEQVKKDYGYADANIQLTLDESTEGILGGGWHSSGNDFRIYYKNILEHNGNVFDRQTKSNILGTFFHEFQHVKQTEYCIRTDIDKYVNSIKNDDVLNQTYITNLSELLKSKERLAEVAKQKSMTVEQVINVANQELAVLKTKGYQAMPDYVKVVNAQVDTIKTRLNELFGKYEKFKPGSEEYKLGEQYTQNYGNYVEAQKGSANEEYMAQIIEKEAFKAEDMSKDIPKRLRSIWNVFSA